MASHVVDSRNGMTIVTFTAVELSPTTLVLELGQALEALIQRDDVRWLLLNFRNVAFINSEMLGRLTMLRKKCLTCDAKLKICEVNPNLSRILKLVRLDALFAWQPTPGTVFFAGYGYCRWVRRECVVPREVMTYLRREQMGRVKALLGIGNGAVPSANKG